jgi:hypothetical protein
LAFILLLFSSIMDAIQEKIAAWLPRELAEQLVSQQQKPAAANNQPWVLEVR